MSYLLRRTAISALFVFGLSLSAFGRNVTVAWNANKETNLSGYVIRYGTSSRTYTASVDVGNRTTFALTLNDFTTYYVAVEAYNVAGSRSVLSSEVVVGPDYSTCGFKLNTASATIGGAASSLTVALSAQPACPWSAVRTQLDPCRRSDGDAGAGDGVVGNFCQRERYAASGHGRHRHAFTADYADRRLLRGDAIGRFRRLPTRRRAGSISVSAGTQCGWTVGSDASWVTSQGPPRGSARGASRSRLPPTPGSRERRT